MPAYFYPWKPSLLLVGGLLFKPKKSVKYVYVITYGHQGRIQLKSIELSMLVACSQHDAWPSWRLTLVEVTVCVVHGAAAKNI